MSETQTTIINNLIPGSPKFKFADNNGDGMLSDAEIRRCSNPVLIKNISTDETRMVHISDDVKIFSFEEAKVKENEIQFYSGLKKEDTDMNYSSCFEALDKDGNGELSEKEIKEASVIQKELDETKQQLASVNKRLKKKKETVDAYIYAGFILSSFPGMILGNEFFKDKPEHNIASAFGKLLAPLIIGVGISMKLGRKAVNIQAEEKEKEDLLNNINTKIKDNEYFKNSVPIK